MTDIQFLDALGTRPINSIRLGELGISDQVIKGCLIRNIGSKELEKVRVRVVEAGQSATDYSYLQNRAVMQLRYKRQTTLQDETIYVALTGIRVTNELEDIDLRTSLEDGVVQTSSDTFRWGSFAEAGPLKPSEDFQIFVRRKKVDPLTKSQTFRFTVRNIGTDTLLNAVLDACCGPNGSDQLSLDGINWTEHLSLGDLGVGQTYSIQVLTYQLSPDPQPAELIVESLPQLGAEQPYPTPTVLSSILLDMTGSGRYYASLSTIREYLQTINIDVVSSDEEILDLILKSAQEIDKATRRRFDVVTVTETYDGSGQQKLVLHNYPVIKVHEVKIFNYNNQLIRDIKETEPDFALNIIIDYANGFITLPSAVFWLAPPFGAYWPASSYGGGYALRGTDFDYVNKFGRGIANVEVNYTYGFQMPPEGIRDACKKMVVIELLKKKGASDTQGSSVVSIAGMSETFTQQAAQRGSGPYAALIGDLQADVDATLEHYRKKRLLVV